MEKIPANLFFLSVPTKGLTEGQINALCDTIDTFNNCYNDSDWYELEETSQSIIYNVPLTMELCTKLEEHVTQALDL